MCLDDLPGDIQAESQAPRRARRDRLLVPLEDPFRVVMSDAYSVIDNDKTPDGTSRLDPDFDRFR